MNKYLSLNNEVLSEYEAKGTINREKDLEATRNFFFENINRNTMFFHDLEEKLSYLVREGYYESEFLEMYDFTFVKSLFKYAYDQNFRFPSFMSASKFYDSYAMKSRDGKDILERYEDRLCIISLYLAQGNEKDAMDFLKYMLTSYQPATPTALNSGKKARGELVSCFKIEMSDSMNSIAHRLGNALELSRLGGGVGEVYLCQL